MNTYRTTTMHSGLAGIGEEHQDSKQDQGAKWPDAQAGHEADSSFGRSLDDSSIVNTRSSVRCHVLPVEPRIGCRVQLKWP